MDLKKKFLKNLDIYFQKYISWSAESASQAVSDSYPTYIALGNLSDTQKRDGQSEGNILNHPYILDLVWAQVIKDTYSQSFI